MKKILHSIVVLLIIVIFIINIFIKSNSLTEIIIFSTNLFIKNIFPSLFPMFVISSVLVELSIPQTFGVLFGKATKKIFKTTETASFVFFMSMITGFPSSAKYINDLLNKNAINTKDAEKIIMFTFFSNPLFIINTIGNTFCHSINIGLMILIVHFLGNIIVGLIFRNYHKEESNTIYSKTKAINDLSNNINSKNIFRLFFKGINSSIEILVNIFGIVTFFLIVINLLFDKPTILIEIIITGILEMTTGLKYLSLTSLSLKLKVSISAFFLSFGGLSVHSQMMNVLTEKKVRYLPFLIARVIHGLICFIIFMIIL